MLAIFGLFIHAFSLNSFCFDSACKNCTNFKLNFDSSNCLDLCPKGFEPIENNTKCNATSIRTLFALEFHQEKRYSISSIGDFYHPDRANFQNNKMGPIPTKDRGFYFSDTSRLLTSKSYILAPNFGLGIIIRVISPGTIFSIINGTDTIFMLSSDATNIQSQYKTCLLNICSLKVINIPRDLEWNLLALNSNQKQDVLSVTREYTTYSISGEFTPIPSHLSYFFGSASNSFKGFIYSFVLSNSVVIMEMNSLPNLCTSTQYFFNNTCFECDSSKIWPLCTFSTGSLCFSPNCTKCTGYGYVDCDDCMNDLNPGNCLKGKNCINGNRFACTECENLFTNANSLCINPPQPVDSKLMAVNLDFGNFIDNNPVFGFENNTFVDLDETKPTPMVKRGYYFDGSTYLKSKVPISLNHSFVLSFWYLPKSGLLFNSKTLGVYSTGYMSIKLSNIEEAVTYYTDLKLKGTNKWTFVAFSVSFQNNITKVFRKVDDNESEVLAVTGYAFYDDIGNANIGCSLNKGNCYVGFIYTFDIWQYYFKILNETLILECSNGNSHCLRLCEWNQYYNEWERICLDCNTKCQFGCRDWSNCEKCIGPECTSCQSNYTGSCLSTISQSESCAESLIYRGSVCCAPSCKSCYGPYFFKCTLCEVLQLSSDSICVDICPTGYTQNSTSCTSQATEIFYIELTNYSSPSYEKKSLSVLKFGSNEELFANLTDQTSPIPTGYRGYYFNSSRFITGPKLVLAPSFSFYFWIRASVDGVVFRKGNLEMYSNSSLKYELSVERNQKILTKNEHTMESKNAWVMYSVIFSKTYGGITTVTFGVDQSFKSITHTYLVYFDSSQDKVIVGSVQNDSFHGFLYMMKIYNFDLSTTAMIANYKVKYSSWNCGLDYYYENSCKLCDSKCDTCVRSGD